MSTDIPTQFLPPAGSVTIFSTAWCGYCNNLKRQLTRENIPFREIDIEQTDGAAKVVEDINKGNRTVPTVIFPDGTTATNPSLRQVQDSL